MWLFDPASVQAQALRGDWDFFLGAAAIVAVVMFGLILLPLVIWRRKDESLPPQFTKNRAMSAVYILVPCAIVAALFYVTFVSERSVDAVALKPDVAVDVTGFRWSWRFDYPGTGISIVGTPQTPPTLVLPVGKMTQINLTSSDVIHGFWIPGGLFKRDAIPGMTNRFDLTPIKIGFFRGVCSQFCGLNHALMTFRIAVVSQAEYRRWIAGKGTSTP
ncbi:MAG: cytochrome c oxidase subunit II [Vulcanimicrobiaceae bacterium]|jgi:cytochrome c oxidase subunit 2